MERAVAWELERDAGTGTEVAFVRLTPGRMRARGAAVRIDPEPYLLEYSLRAAPDYVTRSLRVSTRGKGWRRALDLRRTPDGSWTCNTKTTGTLNAVAPGCSPDELRDALDCDLGLSPLTNTMPVLRHRLLEGGGPIDFAMAWISVPDLRVVRSLQRYEFVRRDGGGALIRYGGGSDRSYEIVFDGDGLVIDYHGLARRISRRGTAE